MENIITVHEKLYLVKKKFPLDRVKDINILNELKWYWNSDTLIKSESHNIVILAQKIDEAIILDETFY